MKLNSPGDYHERTLCQVNREIYRDLKKRGFADDHPTMVKLFEAYDMGKKLNNKLRQYKFDYDLGWWKKHKLDGGSLTDDPSEPDPCEPPQYNEDDELPIAPI